jgi:hypothetical protein
VVASHLDVRLAGISLRRRVYSVNRACEGCGIRTGCRRGCEALVGCFVALSVTGCNTVVGDAGFATSFEMRLVVGRMKGCDVLKVSIVVVRCVIKGGGKCCQVEEMCGVVSGATVGLFHQAPEIGGFLAEVNL